jgi:hypothetical protein
VSSKVTGDSGLGTGCVGVGVRDQNTIIHVKVTIINREIGKFLYMAFPF